LRRPASNGSKISTLFDELYRISNVPPEARPTNSPELRRSPRISFSESIAFFRVGGSIPVQSKD
jgi:hypothetical protein